MKTSDLDYSLAPDRIAQEPAGVRSDSRLLVLDRAAKTLTDARFADLGRFLRPGDCLVLNDTKVLPARFLALRRTGARLEGLFLAETAPGLWEALIKGSRRVRPGEDITLLARDGRDWGEARIQERLAGGSLLIRPEGSESAQAVLDRIGLPPLPPYIKRGPDPGRADQDLHRYQTVYARAPGAVAAPTAGLHFTPDLLNRLQDQGIEQVFVTLHVGTGTFKPVATEDLEDHPIHAEQVLLTPQAAQAVNRIRAAQGRVIAVGTTSARTLESAAAQTGAGWQVRPLEGPTRLFITPGYAFRIVDCLITNFHLPRTTLLALVAAFAGLDTVLAAYQHAVSQGYRFYSYGDAMLIL
ncbi:MAG: tRNA preQ1(34) S-adenosylmethionine ribosyltransferase-isomerase QueA [Phycisphaerae bacterium]|nr:tRNA preQ1(34) S-adenosylmethionine ribosyltransferase-isomerase QueA [Phycisphaerae bacterium]